MVSVIRINHTSQGSSLEAYSCLGSALPAPRTRFCLFKHKNGLHRDTFLYTCTGSTPFASSGREKQNCREPCLALNLPPLIHPGFSPPRRHPPLLSAVLGKQRGPSTSLPGSTAGSRAKLFLLAAPGVTGGSLLCVC